ncbi:MAG: FCD domain-containing protein [[Clostridium] scindens]
MEELSVQLACEKITKEEIRELERVAKEFQQVVKSSDITEIAEVDVRFHDIIYTATDNQKAPQSRLITTCVSRSSSATG